MSISSFRASHTLAVLTAGALVPCALLLASAGSADAAPGPAAAPVVPTAWTTATTLQSSTAPAATSPLPVISLTTVADRSVAIWAAADTHSLMSATRPDGSYLWSTPSTISTDGSYSSDAPGSAASAAAGPNGDVVVAWVAPAAGTVEMSTLSAASGSWSTPSIRGTGTNLTDAHVSIGTDGTTAVVWDDGTSVYATMRTPGSALWSYPVVVSDPAAGVVAPPVKNAQVAVSSSGATTVAWQVLTGVQTNGSRIYRLEASTYVAAFGGWSPSSWLSPAGDLVSDAALSAGDDGSVAAAWLGRPVNSPAVAQARIGVFGTWTEQADLGSDATDIAVASGVNGAHTFIWSAVDTDGVAPPAVRSASYSYPAGWSSAVDVARPDSAPNQLQALNAGDGTVTAAWVLLDLAPDLSTDATVFTSTLKSRWATPTSISAIPATADRLAMSVGSTGYLTVIYDNELPAVPGSSGGRFVVQAASAIAPTLISTSLIRLTGTVSVGHPLSIGSGSWNYAATSWRYQWNRNGRAITGATRATYSPTTVDIDKSVTVTITGSRAGFRSGTATSVGVIVPRPALRNVSRPRIIGTVSAGSVLTADVGTWSDSASLVAYQWRLDGRAVRGATSAHFRVTPADRKHSLTVDVIASRPSFTTGRATSVARKVA